MHDGAAVAGEVCSAERLRLITDDIRYVSHWITPVGERRRFDTRFLLARAPQAQEPLHDDARDDRQPVGAADRQRSTAVPCGTIWR